MPKFNLELFKIFILNFAYIHSKRRKLGIIYLSKQKKFTTNSQISLNFNFWSRDMLCDYN